MNKVLLRKVGGGQVDGTLVSQPQVGERLKVCTGADGGVNLLVTSEVTSVEQIHSELLEIKTKNSKYHLFYLSDSDLLREV